VGKGYKVLDLTDNELAKLHIRHMVGGRVPAIGHQEVVYRFEFPERPGALLGFLDRLAQDWNISMFHYRNHGAAHARVVAGFQVPTGQRKALKQFFDAMANEDRVFSQWDETDNPAYQLFLR
jgi:threonine dehydratase